MFSRYLLVEASLAVGAVMAAGSKSCPVDSPLSCQNSTAVADTCCFNAPGGQILMTQFWDTHPVTGPEDSWTMHGLWPDNCDGTFESNCDKNRAYKNITQILQGSAPDTLKYMQEFWKDYKGDDETFWEHEFGKHGTCISTLEPTCYADYQPTQEVGDYFTRAVSLFKDLPSHEWLSAAGIVPSTSATYTLEQIQAALSAKHGKPVVVNCKNKELNELWYQYNIQGSVQDGKFTPADPVGSGSTCPKTGIKYLPKGNGSGGGGSPAPAPTTMTTSTGSAPTSTTATAGPAPTGGSAPSGKGRVEVSSGGFLISSGAWYRQNGATPATFTATPGSDGATFTLSSSKGKCAIKEDSSLACGSGVSEASAFGYNGGHLTFDGKDTFYADKTPEGNDQGVVYATQKAVSFQASWTAV
ncbi:ribonuclease T2-like protein [Apiospora saccharicola]|uniref:Ribonuclease T2-like n=1 Tax=Apiospora saccharicola TaxID=335842 RepID=A0ABR1UKQ4_9PEZI